MGISCYYEKVKTVFFFTGETEYLDFWTAFTPGPAVPTSAQDIWDGSI
jgi:hypothetical protein